MTFVHRETVRFRDLDALGHVNNAVYLTYMESARTAWALEGGLISAAEDLPIILARIEVDFRSPVELGETVEIAVTPARIGTKSFELEYELRAGGRVVAEGKSVLVGFDYGTGETIPIPERWRKLLSR